ncbi:heavy metal translocating P-type ATPase [Dehalococcoides mccartyi]|jgi:Cd2+/Zn2+-exporting ATPase|uniref:heavy metal translocating P-type ATPase n=1 Tax=Dehalococcoides mccartyi TaxID=61435 RepID=UPI0004E05113|nr:heavy metal translocating P-type ATPase [Dehalococcoides mccartyi]AII60887.1 zinc-transporting ATPase [Dehalococcoides mccartyi CG5]
MTTKPVVNEQVKTCEHGISGYCSRCAEEEFNIPKELTFIGSALLLFILGMVFNNALHSTPYSWAEYAVLLSAYFLVGWRVVWTALRNLTHGNVFDENFLMTVATVGAIAIHQLPEAVAVMLFYKTGEFVQELSVSRSRRSVRTLLDVRPDYANLKTDTGLEKVSPDQVKVGDIIIVKPGEKIPLDGEIIDGQTLLDTSALTGESVPRSAKSGEQVLAGMISKTGMITIKVTKRFSESSIARILELVENAAARKAPTEKFITTFTRYYTPVVVFGALLVAVVPPLFIPGATFSEWIYRALILLVISCPCALVISIPLGYFGGIGGASRKGILIKGSTYLDALTAVKTVVFDKTGTLTKGVFKVTNVVTRNGFSQDELLRLAAETEVHSNHPIAQSILEAYGKKVDPSVVRDYQEIPGNGVRAQVNGQIIMAGNDRLLHSQNIKHDDNDCCVEGTVVHLVVGGKYAGYITIADEVKEDAAKAISSLNRLGVKQMAMLTGDSQVVAASVAKQVGIDIFYAGLLPEDKVQALEKMKNTTQEKGKIVFVGDGVNDAPVIARADIGVAMGGLGSDAAIETADVVIMTDAPSKLPQAIEVAKRTRTIVWQNILMAFAVKGIFIALGVAGVATIWEAVFADVGVAMLAILNATRAMR